MNFADYQKLGEVNWSTLKSMAESPMQYHHDLTHPKKETPAMALGKAVHCAVFEPDDFPRRYLMLPLGIDRRTTKGKDAYAAAQKAAEGRELITTLQYNRCLAIRDAVRSHSKAGIYLEKGTAEQVMVWTDPATGIKCKGRYDFHSDVSPCLLDLKVIRSINRRLFSSACITFGWHGQAAFYRRGWAELHGGVVEPFRFICVKSTEPHDVVVRTLAEDGEFGSSMKLGEQLVDRLLRQLAECRAADKWPGQYPEGEETFDLPRYAFTESDDSQMDLLAAEGESLMEEVI